MLTITEHKEIISEREELVKQINNAIDILRINSAFKSTAENLGKSAYNFFTKLDKYILEDEIN